MCAASVAETANRAVLAVRLEHAFAEGLLMKALAHLARHVTPTNVGFRSLGHWWHRRKLPVVHGDRERQRCGVIPDDEHRPRRHVATGHDAVEVDKGHIALTRDAERGSTAANE
jgi:hypothetical protein